MNDIIQEVLIGLLKINTNTVICELYHDRIYIKDSIQFTVITYSNRELRIEIGNLSKEVLEKLNFIFKNGKIRIYFNSIMDLKFNLNLSKYNIYYKADVNLKKDYFSVNISDIPDKEWNNPEGFFLIKDIENE